MPSQATETYHYYHFQQKRRIPCGTREMTPEEAAAANDRCEKSHCWGRWLTLEQIEAETGQRQRVYTLRR